MQLEKINQDFEVRLLAFAVLKFFKNNIDFLLHSLYSKYRINILTFVEKEPSKNKSLFKDLHFL